MKAKDAVRMQLAMVRTAAVTPPVTIPTCRLRCPTRATFHRDCPRLTTAKLPAFSPHMLVKVQLEEPHMLVCALAGTRVNRICVFSQAALGVPIILCIWNPDAKWPNPFKTPNADQPEKRISALQRIAPPAGRGS